MPRQVIPNLSAAPTDPAFHDSILAVVGVEPVIGFENGASTDVQETHKDSGYPVWKVALLVTDPFRATPAAVNVKVPYQGDLVADAMGKPGSEIRFGNLRHGAWVSDDRAGEGGLYMGADSVAVGPAPSQSRNKANGQREPVST